MTAPARAAAIVCALAITLAVCIPGGATSSAPRAGALSISIILPVNGSTVKGDVTIVGNASGPDGVSLSVQLSIDGGPWHGADGGQGWAWLWSTYAFADGPHTLTARVQGSGSEATAMATCFVRNAKPSFILKDVFPPGDDIHLRAGEVAGFDVTVETYYIGSVLIAWSLDGDIVQSGGANWYNYTAQAGFVGNHTVQVLVSADGMPDAVHSWNLTERASGLPPVISGSGPAERNVPVLRYDTVRFNVTAADPQGKGLTFRWSYDLAPAPGNVTAGSISILFNSTGAHVVEVLVSNGETNRTVRWNVTVEEAPTIGLLDLLPCTLYIVIGLFLGIWHGRRTRVQGSGPLNPGPSF